MAEIRPHHLAATADLFVRVTAHDTVGEIKPQLKKSVVWVIVEFAAPRSGEPDELSWSFALAGVVRSLNVPDTAPIGLLPHILTSAVSLDRQEQGIGEALWRMRRVRDGVLVVTERGDNGQAEFVGVVGDPQQSMTRGQPDVDGETRFLRGVVEVDEPYEVRTSAFAPGRRHDLILSIGPYQAGLLMAEAPAPSEKLSTSQKLEVTVYPPWCAPVKGEMRVPATGPSRDCVLDIGVVPQDQPGPHHLMIMVASRGVPIQTATLIGEATDGEPEHPMRLLIDASLWPQNEPMTTLISDADQLVTTAPDETDFELVRVSEMDTASKEFHESINFPLSSLAGKFGLEDPETIEVLREIAQAGRDLYDDLFEDRPENARSVAGDAAIRIISRDARVDVPLELFYDRVSPSAESTLCEGAVDALLTGTCDHCGEIGTADFICPLGFWGLRRVIERQILSSDGAGVEPLRLTTAEAAERPRLEPFAIALFAKSERVDDGSAIELAAAINDAGMTMDTAENWADWSLAVTTSQPPPDLLVVMPHVDQVGLTSTMEVGDDRLNRREISDQFIRHPRPAANAPGPVVLLLGCETASAPIAHRTMTSRFLSKGASIVVGTRMPVNADSAPVVGAALLRSLALCAEQDRSFGDAVLMVRRQLVADGQLIALALVAYGDGGWMLTRNEAA